MHRCVLFLFLLGSVAASLEVDTANSLVLKESEYELTLTSDGNWDSLKFTEGEASLRVLNSQQYSLVKFNDGRGYSSNTILLNHPQVERAVNRACVVKIDLDNLPAGDLSGACTKDVATTEDPEREVGLRDDPLSAFSLSSFAPKLGDAVKKLVTTYRKTSAAGDGKLGLLNSITRIVSNRRSDVITSKDVAALNEEVEGCSGRKTEKECNAGETCEWNRKDGVCTAVSEPSPTTVADFTQSQSKFQTEGQCTLTSTCNNGCYGRCGPGCTCWSWVCGNCGCWDGCREHDYYCSCIGMWHFWCINVFWVYC